MFLLFLLLEGCCSFELFICFLLFFAFGRLLVGLLGVCFRGCFVIVFVVCLSLLVFYS